MDPQELLKVIVAARKARADGVPIEAINQDIQARTGAVDLAQLVQMWADAANAEEDPTGALAEHNAAGGSKWGSAVSDFGRSMAEGATFGFADELAGLGAAMVPGGRGYSEARDESRARMDRLREVDPAAATMGEIAGGVAVPALGTSGLFKAASPVARAAGRGAVAGAGAGALFGAGSSEGGLAERALGATEGAITGGLFGGVAGAASYPIARGASRALGRLTGRGAQRGERLAGAMAEGADVDPSVRAMREGTEAAKARVSASHFQPIERRFAEGIDDPALVKVLGKEDIAPHTKKVIGKLPSADAPVKPNFTEIQSIRQRLQREVTSAKRAGDLNRMKDAQAAISELDDVLSRVIPDYADARAEWARVIAPEKAFDEARKLFTKSSEEILMALESQPSREAADAFRAGLLNRFVTKLQQRSTPSNGVIRALTEAGPEMEAKLRTVFPDDASFQEFMRVVRVERNYMKAHDILRRTLPWLAGGGVGVGIGQSLFQ